MKANEFVRKFGLDAAKHKADELKIIESMGDKLSFEDENLKRLVESHDLVGSKGGLAKCKEILAENNFTWVLGGRVCSNPLEKAIADVESCMEGV